FSPTPKTESIRYHAASAAAASATGNWLSVSSRLVSRTQSKTTRQAADTFRSSSSAAENVSANLESADAVALPATSRSLARHSSSRASDVRAAVNPSSVKLNVSR